MTANWDMEYDVVIVGSGAGGLTTAVTAALGGAGVIVLEKAETFGGSTAISGGVVWIPDNAAMKSKGQEDSKEAALTYLRGILGNRMREDMVSAFLDAGPEMVDYLEKHTCVRLAPRMYGPDYKSENEGAVIGGRGLDPVEYDGRELGDWFSRLRAPLPQMTAFNGMMVSRYDIDHLLAWWKKPSSFIYSMKILSRYALDRLGHPRGTRLLAGNALAARLLKSAVDAGVELVGGAPVARLIAENGRVSGCEAVIDGKTVRIQARRGLVLAAGGGAANPRIQAEHVPHADQHLTMAPEGGTGDSFELARAVGAVVDEGNVNSVFLTPVSVRRSAGREVRFPHLILDRQKPGLIAVDKTGRRFVNEADSYHDFVEGMHRNAETAIPAWLICDADFLARYGLGLARPAPFPKGGLIRDGYLKRGATLDDLARQIGVPADALKDEVAVMNTAAKTGTDPRFGKGSTEYNRYLGDLSHKPNPCLGPIRRAPFYAVEVWPGDIGSSRGLKADAGARVLDSNDQPIEGLYVCGNDMNSIMAGHYPSGGITLGPAMTFGYVIGRALPETDAAASLERSPT